MQIHVAAAALLCLTVATASRADDDKESCVAEHIAGQIARNAGHFKVARDHFLRCTSTCPKVGRGSVLVKECTEWLNQVDQEQPSLIVAAADERGRDLVDVEVAIDDTVVATKLGGTPIAIDPGEHQMTLRLADGRHVTRTIVARENEQARVVAVTFPPLSEARVATRPHVESAPRHVPVGTWVLGGLAVASAIPWATFGILGLSTMANLYATCKGSCPPGQIDDIKRDYLVADITGSVTLAAAAGALLWAVFTKRPSPLVVGIGRGGGAMLFEERF